MAERDATPTQPRLGPNAEKVRRSLVSQIDRLFDVEALLNCAEEAIAGLDGSGSAESARRTISVAIECLENVRNTIDEEALAVAMLGKGAV